MIKIIPPGSYDFGEPATRLIKVGRQRIGVHDRRELLKYAGESFVEKLARVEKYPGEELALNIALGSTESIGCFVPGTPVVMADGSRRPIEEVCRGDYVLTHRGRYRRVLATFWRQFDGDLMSLAFDGSGFVLCTPNHEFRIRVGEDPAIDAWIAASDLPANARCLRPIPTTTYHESTWKGDWPRAYEAPDVAGMRGTTCRLARKSMQSYSGLVFNLEVEEDNSYAIVNGLAVHNSNRNGDGFRAEWCRRNHDTFVKSAHAYRNHLNKNPRKSYGRVVLSDFNEPMQRIELGIAYNGTKEAAERNRGLVADLEIEKLASGYAFPSSMACLVKHDSCSGCGNKARSRDEYCRGSMCKYGGLYENIGKTFADGHTLHADNPDPRWFDISYITPGRGADRTSFTLGRIEKAAAAFRCGAALAEDLGLLVPPDGVLGPPATGMAKVAADMATAAALPATWELAFVPDAGRPLADLPDLAASAEKMGSVMRALADARVVLPVREFLTLTLRDAKQAAELAPLVAPMVPRAYAAIAADADSLGENPFAAARSAAAGDRAWAAKVAADYGLSREAASRRVAFASVRGIRARSNSIIHGSAAAAALARQYATYKVAALDAMRDAPDRDWLFAAAATQDRAAARE